MRLQFVILVVGTIAAFAMIAVGMTGYYQVYPVAFVLIMVVGFLVIRRFQRSKEPVHQAQQSQVVREARGWIFFGLVLMCSSAITLYFEWADFGYFQRFWGVMVLCTGVMLFRKGRSLRKQSAAGNGSG